jgi:hypothetical protein
LYTKNWKMSENWEIWEIIKLRDRYELGKDLKLINFQELRNLYKLRNRQELRTCWELGILWELINYLWLNFARSICRSWEITIMHVMRSPSCRDSPAIELRDVRSLRSCEIVMRLPIWLVLCPKVWRGTIGGGDLWAMPI